MVLDVLRAALERAGVDVACSCEVAEVAKGPGGFSVRTRDGRAFSAARVVLAAGGQAGPQFGTDGSAFALARMLGTVWRSVSMPCSAAVRRVSRRIEGVRANCALSLYLDGRCAGTERGEVQFAEYGLSGIPAMQLSCLLGPGVKKAGTSVDFFPERRFLSCAGCWSSAARRACCFAGDASAGARGQKAGACDTEKLRPAAAFARAGQPFPQGSERSGQCA